MSTRLFTLPNIVSLANLAAGCAATVAAVRGDLSAAFWLVAAAAAFDLLDGLVARLTGQYSDVGRELDSLCDVVSFGVAPAAAMHAAWAMAGGGEPWVWAAYLLALFSALRLARFNLLPPSDDFRGLPVPASALSVVSLATLTTLPAWIFPALTAVLCVLLICPLRMFSLKFACFPLRPNAVRYCFLAAAAVLVALLGIPGVAASVALYVAISAIVRAAPGSRHRQAPEY